MLRSLDLYDEILSLVSQQLLMHDTSSIDSRYQVLRTIGVGGMGVVYLVVDTRRSNQLMALKTLKSVQDEAAIESFRAEFRNIRGVVHPHIPEVFDFGRLPASEGGYYFTTEFVDGKPLDQLAADWKHDQLRTVLVSLCRALAFLHSRGLLHRDIKPDNVLGKLTKSGEFATLKLVDFGLAGNHSEVTEEAGGTLDYMAPEVIQSGQSSVASDLYALGMLMYRLATGKLPFEGKDAVALAQLRTKHDAPHPLRYRAELPIGLADVIAALIEINPADRPKSARHVIAMLNERDGSSFDYETTETRKAYISSSGIVTNANARQEFSRHKEILSSGDRPENLVVTGEHGLGCTRLLKDLAVELTLSGFSTRVVNTVRDLPLHNQKPQALVVPDISALPSDRIRETFRNPILESCWWLIGSHSVGELPDFATGFKKVELAPLNEEGIGEFVKATFPDNIFPFDFSSQLMGQTLGYPSALEAALEQLVSTDILRIGLSGWELMPGRWKLPIHDDIARAIQSRFEHLSFSSKSVLKCLACSPTPLSFEVVSQAIGFDSGVTPQSVCDELAATGWIRTDDFGTAITHHAVVEYVNGKLSEQERIAAHASLYNFWMHAEDIDELTRTQELLFHDFMSGAYRTPAVEAEKTIEDAVRMGKLNWARKLLENSLGDVPKSHKAFLQMQLARIEYIEGDFHRAAALLGQVTNNGKVEITKENLLHVARYANLREKLGYPDEAEEILNRCMPLLDEHTSQAAGSVYGTLAWISFKRGEGERARMLAERGLTMVPSDATDAGFALLLNTMATLAFYRGDTDVARVYWQRCLEVYEAIADRKGIANMYNNLGVLASQSGDRLRARNLWERCVTISKHIDDIQRLAGIYNNLGIDSLESGDLREAEDYYLKALALFRKLESPREQTEILSNLGELAFQRADYPRALAYLQEAVAQASAIGDSESQLEPMIYLGKLLLTLEDIEKSERTLGHARDIAASIGTRKAEGQALEGLASLFARRGDFTRAHEAADRAKELLSDESDPLALLHLHLTCCQIAAENGEKETVHEELIQARKVGDTKWDPFTAARTQLIETLYAGVALEPSKWQVALRKLSSYPDLLWKFHWATGRQLARSGQPKKALEEFGRGVAVLKAIATRLPEETQTLYLQSPGIVRFKQEAVELRKSMQTQE